MVALPQRAASLSIIFGLFALWIGQSSAATNAKYCSGINTGSGAANYSIFQSNGLCDTFCDGYAYAVIQDSACWCSDFTPASSITVDLAECDMACPGFPPDFCGKTDEYYIYIFRNQAPSGTLSAAPSSTTQRTTTVQDTDNFSDPQPSTSPNESSGGIPATTTPGGVHTGTPNPDTPVPDGSAGEGLSTGATIGIAVGVVVSIIAISAFIFFLWWKKRRGEAGSSGEPSPRSSSAGMVSTLASMTETGEAGTRRGSKFIPIDDRMEYHHGIYARGEGRLPSRESVDSLRDDVDYSRRVLRATNPDLPHD